jgi:hypothetical protein
MGKNVVVYSTLSSDISYTNFSKGGGDIPLVESSVFIKGGAGLANDRLITPMGVATVLQDDEKMTAAQKLEALRQNSVFQMHVKNGYIIVSEDSVDPEKMASDMNNADPSKPLNDQQLVKDGGEIAIASGKTKSKL